MPKALLPMIATLALCGGTALAVIATTAHAQPEPKKPMLVAATAPETGANPPARDFRRTRPAPGEIAAHLREMCGEAYAREAGAMAYLDARLDLSAAQKPGFERWKQVKLDIAKRRADSCATMEQPRAAAQRPSVVDLMARHEDMLKRQLADVSAERPALETFYKSLSTEQQHLFARAAAHRMMERGHMFVRRNIGTGPGPMDHMMRRGPMPPEGPANAPPAPPPQ